MQTIESPLLYWYTEASKGRFPFSFVSSFDVFAPSEVNAAFPSCCFICSICWVNTLFMLRKLLHEHTRLRETEQKTSSILNYLSVTFP